MKKHLYLLFVIFLISITKSFSQAGIYVKFDGIIGDQTGVHANEFLVTAFETTDSSNVVINSGTGGGSSSKTNFGLIKLQKVLVPKSNPAIMLFLANGRHIATAMVIWYNNSNAAYYQINLQEVILQSVSILSPACSGTNCNNLYEEIHFVYSTIQWKDPVSNTSAGWDLRKNAPL